MLKTFFAILAFLVVLTGAGGNTTAGQNINNLSGSGPLILRSTILTINQTVDSTYAGVISGTGGIIKHGMATLTLSGVSTYTGHTTINEGTLALGGDGSIAQSSGLTITGGIFDISAVTTGASINGLTGEPGATVILGDKTLTIKPTETSTYAGVISGTGGIVKQGTSTLILSGSVNAGAMDIQAGQASLYGPTTLDGGGLNVANGATLGLLLGNTVNVTNGGVVTLANGSNLSLSGGDIGQTYDLINANGETIQVNIGQLQQNLTFDNARKWGELRLTGSVNDILQLAVILRNLSLVWTGGENNLWDTQSANWSGSPDGKFVDGDTVTFNGAAPGEIQVQDGGVTVGAMNVDDGEYAFVGGDITGDSLNLNGGQIIVANDIFFTGIDVYSGATLGLAATGGINNGNVAASSHFTLHSGATLLAEPGETSLQINAETITLQSGSQVGVKGFDYGPLLNPGQYTVLTLNGANITNNSSIIATSGSIAVGIYDYKYRNLAWSADGKYLTMQVGDESAVNSIRRGDPPMTGASHIAALNPAFNIFSYHAKGMFGTWNNLPYTELTSSPPGQYDSAAGGAASNAVSDRNIRHLNYLWIIPNYINVNQSASGGNVGYLLQTPGFALGYDRQLNENAFMGAGVSLSWPDYTDGTADINATDITFALYGGMRLPYALELNGHLGFGFTRYSQDRQVDNERYSEKYNGNNFFVGLGIGRPFALGGGFSLRPGVAYDLIHLNIDGFDEGAGTYALKSEDHSMHLHRVKAGVDLSWTETNSGLTIGGEVYYMGVYGDREAETTGHFVNDPVNGFTMLGNGLDRDNLGLGLKVALPVGERWEFGAGYNVLFGADTVSQQGLLSAAYKF